MNLTHTSRALLAAAGLTVLSGCAALQVDVAVYKGPLANHQDIQTEQAAVMAIGVKPLLIQLRDKLECERATKPNKTFCDSALYQADFVPEGSLEIKDVQARQVNAILSLYHDLGENRWAVFTAEARRATHRYHVAYTTLFDETEGEGNSGQWGSLAKQMDFQETLGRHRQLTEGDLSALRDAYGYFFLPKEKGWRKPDDVISRYQEIARKIPSAPRTHTPFEQCMQTATLAYSCLSDTSNVRLHANLLFPSSASAARKEFISRVTKIAQSFADARDSLATLLQLTLQAVTLMKNSPNHASASTLHQHLAKLAVTLISSNHWCGYEKCLPKKRFRIKNNTLSDLFSHPMETGTKLLQDIENEHRKGYRYGIATGPKDENSPEITFKMVEGSIHEVVESIRQDSNGLGLQRGRLSAGLDSLVEEYLNAHSNDIERGVERRRLMNALARFAQKVLSIADNAILVTTSRDDRKKIEPYVRTLQAVGNSILVLIDDLRRQEDYDRKIEALGAVEMDAYRKSVSLVPQEILRELSGALEKKRAALVCESCQACEACQAGDAECAKKKKACEKTKAECEKKKTACETNGTNLENAIKAINTHGDAVVKATAKFSAPVSPDAVIDKLIELAKKDTGAVGELKKFRGQIPAHPGEGAVAGVTALDVMDMLFAQLRHEQIQAARLGVDSPRAKQLQEALKRAYVRNAELMYIRPALAYLRSSSPAPTLQEDGAASRSNMLSSIGSSGCDEDEPCRIAKELDKQYWHTINRIDLSSVGKGNYVLAKDHLGNWYVKSYSSDPDKLIATVKNLALFAGGTTAAVTSPGTTETKSLPEKQTEVADGKKDAFVKELVKSTKELLDKLQTLSDGLGDLANAISTDAAAANEYKNQVKAAFDTAKSNWDPIVTAAKENKKQIKAPEGDSATHAKMVEYLESARAWSANQIKSLLKYGADLKKAIDEVDPAGDSAKEAYQTAALEVIETKIVQPTEGHITARKNTLSQYEQRLALVRDFVPPTEEPAPAETPAPEAPETPLAGGGDN